MKIEPEMREEILNKAIKLNDDSLKEIPPEVLERISGGAVFESIGDCPCCGGKDTKYLYVADNGAWAICCILCDEIFASEGELPRKTRENTVIT